MEGMRKGMPQKVWRPEGRAGTAAPVWPDHGLAPLVDDESGEISTGTNFGMDSSQAGVLQYAPTEPEPRSLVATRELYVRSSPDGMPEAENDSGRRPRQPNWRLVRGVVIRNALRPSSGTG